MKNKKTLGSLILVFVLLAVIVTGCTTADTTTTATTPPTTTTSSATTTTTTTTTTVSTTTTTVETPAERTVTVTDMSGDTVTITGEIKKIINLWPAGTSSFFIMGAGDLIVGLASNSPGTMNAWTQLFYPGCVDIPALGGVTPTIENLINLEPDLVIIHPSSAASGFAQQIRDVGIPAININFSNYETMMQAYTILGEVLGGEYQEKLGNWCSAVETKLANVRSLTEGLAEADRPVVYYISGQSDSLTATMASGSIINDWVESAGGIYAADRLEFVEREVTAESVFALNPDMMVCGGVYQHIEKNALETTDGWKDLNAVTTGRVYNNPYGCFNWDRFGLESQLQINYALLCIQPEIAAANGITRESIIEEIMDFYQAYTNYELTYAQAENMLNGLRPDGTAEYSVQ